MKKISKQIILFFGALFLLAEEWLWDSLSHVARQWVRFFQLERFEAWLASAPRGVALAAFLLPFAVAAPINVAGLLCFANGQILAGLALELVAKLFSTVLIARIFSVTRNTLMTYGWFAWLYTTINAWLRWAHDLIRASAAYRWTVAMKQRIRIGAQRVKQVVVTRLRVVWPFRARSKSI